MKVNFNCVLLFLLLISSSVLAQGIKFEHYSDEQGLSQNSVRHIIQDNTGLLWFGTFGGLNSFDGNTFTAYLSKSKSKKSINDDDITALVLNQKTDEMWIGSRNGLILNNLKTGEFTTFLPEKDKPNSLPDAEIRALYIDKSDRIWVGTQNRGLCIFNPGTNEFISVEIPGFVYIKSIYEGSNGLIWIGSNSSGGIAKIILSDDGSIKEIKTYTLQITDSEDVNPYVNFIYQDDKYDIFVGTRVGLYKLDKIEDQFHLLPIPNPSVRNLLGPYFTCVAQAPDGKYWLGTLGGLLVCDHLENISTGEYEWYYSVLSDGSSLIDNSVSALYFDHSGILWIGTENGLDKYDAYKNQFKSIKDISVFINDKIPRISGIAQTFDDNLIISTHDNGLFLDKKNKFSVLTQKYKEIAGIYTPDGKTFYCSLWNGNLLIFNYLKNSFKTINLGFNDTPTFAFSKLKDGRLFIGSHGNGAVILNPTDLTFSTQLPEIFRTAEMNQAVTDSDDNLWIATESGVIQFNPEKNEALSYPGKTERPESSSPFSAKDIGIDNHGTIWVASTKGLRYYDAEKDAFISIASPNELRDDWITDIRFGKAGDIWLNFNNNRIGKYNTTTRQLNVYYSNSGNRLDIFSNRGFLLYNDSLIFLPGKNGIIYFPTNVLPDNSVSDPPFITEVKVQNKIVYPGDMINGSVILKENINYARKIEMNYVNRNFSFSFASPSYANVRLNKFQYMLEGFDYDWITVDNNSRNIQYTNLRPDEYVFKIRAGNSNGSWSNVSAYEITIKPPFWLTYKSIILFLLAIVLIVYFIQRQLHRSMKLKQELVLEKVKREKDEKLNDEKLRFFTNISHELRTPISLILGPAQQLLEENKINDYEKSRVNLILNNSKRLLYLVNQLLDFRKAQTGELRLKVTETDILLLTQNIFNSFKSMAAEKKLNFHLITEPNHIIGWLDQDKYDKILYNLLSNAIKFTDKHGNIDLFVGLKDADPNKLIVEVSDDGIGIPKDSLNKIFSRFYQIDAAKHENTGSGIGLSIVKSLVEIHKATIEVRSESSKGSVFIVEIPIGRMSYSDNEIFDMTIKREKNEESEVTAKKAIQTTTLKEKILIVEDNAELRRFLAEYLSDTYKVYEAENGLKGLQKCREIKPILCVADIKMPEKDGFEFCADLKKDVMISHIPVILLTALSENENIIKGYKLGADGYIVKPFDPALLKTRIENIIKSRLELQARFSGEVESEINTLSHSPADEEFMNKLGLLIEENINNTDLNIEFLCNEMNTSSSKLYRKIKELTNLSPNEFIRTIRLKKSAQLLKTKKYNVSEVSDIIGFNDPLYFSRCFKKQFGISPSSLL